MLLENWVNVPTNSILTIHRQTVMMHPILDKYYERDPYHVRSSAFVQAKGLVSNEKAPTSGSLSPSVDSVNGQAKGSTQTTGSRSYSPDVARRSLLPPSLLREVAAVPQTQPTPAASSALPLRSSPAKGNIKVKRSSVPQLESLARQPSSPDEEEDGAGANGMASPGVHNPKKVSQFFPELTLGNAT